METRAPLVAGAGVCCADHIIVAPRVRWGDTAYVQDYMLQGGGLVGTAMVACARLGAGCDLLSLLGDDGIGDQIVAELVAEGIPSGGIQRIKGAKSPFSFVHVDAGSAERTIFHRPAVDLVAPDRLPLTNARNWNALLVDDYFPDLSTAAAAAAKENGVTVVADMVPAEKNACLLKWVDVLIAPHHYARQIGCEDNPYGALDAIHDLGPTTAVMTLGAEGWIFSDPKGRGRGEAFEVEVVDTTGAGDSFHGAFTYSVARGWDTARCAEFASAVAAIKCTKAGGRTGLPSLDQVMRFLAERKPANWAV